MYIIVGLGNPSREYTATRHNIGFDSIIRLADDYNITMNMQKHKAICGTGFIEGQKVLLAMPQTYMNLSGESVRELVDFYKIDPSCELLVIYDDISLEIGQLRLRKKGSAGGHNGIKNIIANLNSQDFYRIRVGVGDKPKEWDLADYVLSRFSKEEEPVIRQALSHVSEACSCIIGKDMDCAMNNYNKKL